MAPVGKHSAKPEYFLEMIEQYFPNLAKNRTRSPRGAAPRLAWVGQ
jgi:hypothetical protein